MVTLLTWLKYRRLVAELENYLQGRKFEVWTSHAPGFVDINSQKILLVLEKDRSSIFNHSLAITCSTAYNLYILTTLQRDAINEILRYASKNRLPEGLKEQMLAHMQLKFKTAELQQEEVLEDLPKAIRSGIAQHLFHGTVGNAYLFKGVSEDLIVQLVKQFPSFFQLSLHGY